MPTPLAAKSFYNQVMKKIILILGLISTSAFSFECKLTGTLESQDKIQTSFRAASKEECLNLAAKTGKNNFFGLLEEDNKLLKTSISFREETGAIRESISFEKEESYSNDG
jgi:hypothetical protein